MDFLKKVQFVSVSFRGHRITTQNKTRVLKSPNNPKKLFLDFSKLEFFSNFTAP